MSARGPRPEQTPRSWLDALAAGLARARAAGSQAGRSAARSISDQPLPLLIGGVSVVVPAIALAFFGPDLPVTTPGVVLLAAIAFATYLADWPGGVAALALAAVVLDLLFVNTRTSFGLPKDGIAAAGLIATLLCGALLVWLVQRIKLQSDRDRRDALAARAAATALTSVEIAAAAHARGGDDNPGVLDKALLRALVSVNRAHAGILYLASLDGGELVQSTTYGFDQSGFDPSEVDLEAAAFAKRCALEGRSRTISDLSADRAFNGSSLFRANLRSILCVPLIDSGGDSETETGKKLLGVALIGLLVPHKFTRTEIARVEALASRAAAMIYAAHGIDERETALNTARAAERWLELVIAAMPEAVVLAAPPYGRITSENQAAIALFGRGDRQYPDLGWQRTLLLPDGSMPNQADLPIETALRTGEIVTGMELLVNRPNGVAIPVLVSAAPVKDPGGPTIAVVAVFREIAALKEASRLKDEFVSVVSHELRSPLTPIRGFVQLVARDLAREGGHESQVIRLNSIAGHVDRMTRLVDDLLDVSRLKTGSLEIRNRRTDMIELAAEVVRDRSATASTHRIELAAGEEPVIGDWDSDRLYQVIDNLIGNALKYSPAGGVVTVAAGSDPVSGDALVSVLDQGPGISPQDRERIFSAFYRTSDATASQIAGLGLGLYICHELVAAHGGRIAVDDAPGHGAKFTVRLPRTTPVTPIPFAPETVATEQAS